MSRADVYLNYVRRDHHTAELLSRELKKQGISVTEEPQALPENVMEYFRSQIRNARGVVLLITPNAVTSKFFWAVAEMAQQAANDRAKKLFPVFVGGTSFADLPDAIRLSLNDRNALFIKDESRASICTLAQMLKKLLHNAKERQVLYEKLSQYRKANANDRASEPCWDLPFPARVFTMCLSAISMKMKTLQAICITSLTGI